MGRSKWDGLTPASISLKTTCTSCSLEWTLLEYVQRGASVIRYVAKVGRGPFHGVRTLFLLTMKNGKTYEQKKHSVHSRISRTY